jgi:hypothetical protein
MSIIWGDIVIEALFRFAGYCALSYLNYKFMLSGNNDYHKLEKECIQFRGQEIEGESIRKLKTFKNGVLYKAFAQTLAVYIISGILIIFIEL